MFAAVTSTLAGFMKYTVCFRPFAGGLLVWQSRAEHLEAQEFRHLVASCCKFSHLPPLAKLLAVAAQGLPPYSFEDMPAGSLSLQAQSSARRCLG